MEISAKRGKGRPEGAKVDNQRPEALQLFAARLRQARTAAGLSQKEVAQACGAASRQAYQAWEYGRQWPSVRYIQPICKALNVSADWLLGLYPTTGYG